jgi:hypothetical protein
MRLELIAPGKTIMDPQMYNQIFTLHGVIMIFLFVIPGIPAVFGNFFLPILVGAKDVAFPRINLLSWWLFVAGGLLAILSILLPGGSADTGWTFYVPYSVRTGTNVTYALFAAFILGFSSILTGLNFVTTVHRLKSSRYGLVQNAFIGLVVILNCMDTSFSNSYNWNYSAACSFRKMVWHRTFSIRRSEAIRFYFNIYFGFILTPQYIL